MVLRMVKIIFKIRNHQETEENLKNYTEPFSQCYYLLTLSCGKNVVEKKDIRKPWSFCSC